MPPRGAIHRTLGGPPRRRAGDPSGGNPKPRAALTLLASLVPLLAACSATPQPAPAERGDWRLAAGTGGLFRSTDAGALGEADEFSAEVGAGVFVSRRLMLELDLSGSSLDLEADDAVGADAELSMATAKAGLRYYFDTSGIHRPYVALRGGAAFTDAEVDLGAGTLDDNDSAFVLEGRAGFETLVSEHVGLEFAAYLQEAFDVELFGVEEDVRQFGVLFGFSLWF